MSYKPSFDCTVGSRTTTSRVTTRHTDYIDWDYPFLEVLRENPCRNFAEGEMEAEVERYKAMLRVCEQDGSRASNYGGCMSLTKLVLGVGMVSEWPYWTPRPSVLVSGTLGPEWIDWRSLTEVRPAPTREDSHES